MSAVGVVLRAVGLGVVWVVSSWFGAGAGYESAPTAPTAPQPGLPVVIVNAAPAAVSYADDAVEVTVTNTGAQTARQVTATARFDGPWALLVDGAAWTADTADTGADTVVTWLVGRLEPGASRTSTLRAIPGSNGGDGPITFTVENR